MVINYSFVTYNKHFISPIDEKLYDVTVSTIQTVKTYCFCKKNLKNGHEAQTRSYGTCYVIGSDDLGQFDGSSLVDELVLR